MNDLERMRAEEEARRHAGRVGHATAYSQALNRFLGAVTHRAAEPAPVPERPRAAKPGQGHRAGLVIVGVDESHASYIAVDHGAIEADLRGWGLRLVHVQDSTGGTASRRDRGARLLERMTERIHACSPTLAVTSRLVVGAPVAALLTDSVDGDLVVVGHRHGGARLTAGLGERVASRHRGTVMVVRVPGWPPGAEFATRPIVAGMDESRASILAMGFAMSEGRRRGCDVILLHAATQTPVPPDRVEETDGLVIHHRFVQADPVIELIIASSRAAAVVVGRRGPSGVAGASLGSVSRSLIRRADCPVFLAG
jgi:nucleotide-binding universal stress UspA family protein